MRSTAMGLLAVVALTGSKPAGSPPLDTGREGTPIEREFHLAPPPEPRATEGVPVLPKSRGKSEFSAIGQLAFPWLAIVFDQR